MTDPNASRPLVTLPAEEYAWILKSDLTSFIAKSFLPMPASAGVGRMIDGSQRGTIYP